MLNAAVEKGIEVIRRVGGLEVLLVTEQTIALVIRRVGGLEVIRAAMPDSLKVIRRVGGLEVCSHHEP